MRVPFLASKRRDQSTPMRRRDNLCLFLPFMHDMSCPTPSLPPFPLRRDGKCGSIPQARPESREAAQNSKRCACEREERRWTVDSSSSGGCGFACLSHSMSLPPRKLIVA